jgi:hypothetical protein
MIFFILDFVSAASGGRLYLCAAAPRCDIDPREITLETVQEYANSIFFSYQTRRGVC